MRGKGRGKGGGRRGRQQLQWAPVVADRSCGEDWSRSCGSENAWEYPTVTREHSGGSNVFRGRAAGSGDGTWRRTESPAPSEESRHSEEAGDSEMTSDNDLDEPSAVAEGKQDVDAPGYKATPPEVACGWRRDV